MTQSPTVPAAPARNILLVQASVEGAAPIRAAADRLCRQAIRKALLAGAGITAGLIVPNRQDGPLEALLARLEEGGVSFLLEHGARSCGLMVLSRELCLAITESQTLGKPSLQGEGVREMTAVDEIFARPVGLVFLAALAAEDPLKDWAAGAVLGDRLEAVALGGIALAAGRYRLLRLEVMVAEDRSGEIAILLPKEGAAAAGARETRRRGEDPMSAERWRKQMRENVMGARIELSAVLQSLKLTLGDVQAWAPGQMIFLQGARLDQVSLVGAQQKVVANGVLGKIGGLRALRLGTAGPADLEDDAGPGLLGQS